MGVGVGWGRKLWVRSARAQSWKELFLQTRNTKQGLIPVRCSACWPQSSKASVLSVLWRMPQGTAWALGTQEDQALNWDQIQTRWLCVSFVILISSLVCLLTSLSPSFSYFLLSCFAFFIKQFSWERRTMYQNFPLYSFHKHCRGPGRPGGQ